MSPSQFTEHAPDRLVPLPEGLMAFVPGALPSSLPMDDETREWSVQVIHSVGRLGGLSEALPGARLPVELFLRQEALVGPFHKML